MSLASFLQISDQDARSISKNRGGELLGQTAGSSDGRVWSYAQAGAVNLAAGLTTSPVATVSNSVNQTGVATSVGQQQITYTVGSTAVAANQYQDGYFVVNDGAGPNTYRIAGNTAATSTGSYSITITLHDAITVATTTSSKFSLYPSQQSLTVVSPNASAPAYPIVGVPNVAVTANYYYWNQTGGMCSVLNDGAITKNAGAIGSNAVDGAVEIEVAGTVTERVGYAPELTVDTKYYPIVLTLTGV